MASPTRNGFSGQKSALVIGIDEYKGCDRPLNHLKKNAEDLCDKLDKIGFTVTPKINTPGDIMPIIDDFLEEIQVVDMILVYFSGLSCHDNDKNYLVPAEDYTPDTDVEFKENANDAERVVERLVLSNKAHTVIMILDCGMPYNLPSNPTVIGNGLIKMAKHSRAFIQFSCSTRETVDDDLFIKHLLRNIERENVPVTKIFQDIREDISHQRYSRQQPFFEDGLATSDLICLNQVKVITRSSKSIKKYALIMGNDNYSQPKNQLTDSIKNASELDDILQEINFDVTRYEDVTEEDTIIEQVISFTKKFRDGDIVLFYFSGHGQQFNKYNYLIPVNDTRIRTERDVEVFGVNVQRILDRLTENKPSSVFVFILDCCRQSAATTTVQSTGLQAMNVPDGRKIFIQFSCAADKTTTDDLFNKYLLQNITRENVSVTEVFRDIAEDVYRKRHRRHQPFSTHRLPEDKPIYLNQVEIITRSPENIKKYALVIGNDNYSRPKNQLTDSIKNANELDDTLHKINFDVTRYEDVTEEDTVIEQVISFTKKFRNGDIVLFYYSGHADQFNGNNYLIPTNDNTINSEQDIEVFGVSFQRILGRLIESKPSSVFLLLLDCCRPYYLPRRSAISNMFQTKGLHAMNIPDGRKIFIQFSCAVNKVSKDDLFNKYLLRNINQKNVPVTEVIQDIVEDVYHKRRRKLRPFSMNGLAEHGPIYLNKVPSCLPNILLNALWKSNAYTIVGDSDPGSTTDKLHSPQGISISKNHILMIADSSNHRIMKYNLKTGRIQRIAGKNIHGDGPDMLAKPSNVIFHPQTKSFIICDYNNQRVLQWYPRSRRCARILIENTACFGLAVDINGALYISDTERHEVRRYQMGAKYGKVVAGGHGQGPRLKQLSHPTYICVGDDRSVYVSDSWNDRVMKWEKGAKEGVIVAGGEGKGKGRRQLDYPGGVLVDRQNTLYVADHWNHRVMRYRNGEEPDIIAGDRFLAGSDKNKLICPEGLAFDRDGNLYVADSNNHRIEKFKIRKP